MTKNESKTVVKKHFFAFFDKKRHFFYFFLCSYFFYIYLCTQISSQKAQKAIWSSLLLKWQTAQ